MLIILHSIFIRIDQVMLQLKKKSSWLNGHKVYFSLTLCFIEAGGRLHSTHRDPH